jgi:fumarate reductase flavoprotein subunit
MAVHDVDGADFDVTAPIVVVGGGACGLTAALAAGDEGLEGVLVLERDPAPQGSTALSSGMIPACGTRAQREAGIDDSADIMAADIQRKARGEADPATVAALCRESGPAIDWLSARHGIDLTLVQGFLYPGHSRLRMHAPPSRTGSELIGGLTRAAGAAGVEVVTDARVTDLFAEGDGRIRGLRIARPDGSAEELGCDALILACNGYGGNPELVRRYMPEMAEANYIGHPGNQGDALLWGRALGAATRHLGAYQGHGSVAHPQGILISWALMMEGGIQVNGGGLRFSNEHEGYSEQARRVMAQPGGIAWDIYDERLHELGLGFDDYRQAVAVGAVRRAGGAEELAESCGLPVAALAATLAEIEALAGGEASDRFGRDFSTKPALTPPYRAVKVTGSLFHTQGGLVVDEEARVLREDGSAFANLFAGGGAACGVSGPADWGYLSGNGLLTAITQGRIAGRMAGTLQTPAL